MCAKAGAYSTLACQKKSTTLHALEIIQLTYHRANENANERKLGGEDKIVECDESLFFPRKYNRGEPRTHKWIFGCIERGTGKV